MIEIEDDGSCDADSGEEGVRASIVSSSDPPPVLDFGEHVLDLVAIFVESHIVSDGVFSAFGGRDAWCDPPGLENGSEAVAVVSPISDQEACGGQAVFDEARALVVAHLAFSEQQDDGAPVAIDDSVELRVQAALGAPDAAGNSPFLSRLAAVRCALR